MLLFSVGGNIIQKGYSDICSDECVRSFSQTVQCDTNDSTPLKATLRFQKFVQVVFLKQHSINEIGCQCVQACINYVN